MKAPLLFLAFALGATFLHAQIPNYGFEDWTATGGYEDPNGWRTMNFICAGPFYSVTKSTDHYPTAYGNFSVRIENNTSLGQYQGGWGIIATHDFIWPPKPAFPISGKPDKFCGYYKFQSQNGDTGSISLILFYQGAVVANTTHIDLKNSDNSWEDFCEDVEYSGYTGPIDSGFIMVMAFKGTSQTDPPNGNSVLYLDNLNFDESISVAENSGLHNLRVYPNPAKNSLVLDFGAEPKTPTNARIYTLAGALLYELRIENATTELNVEALENGFYMLEIENESGLQRTKIVVQK